jgi:hypothetical protein
MSSQERFEKHIKSLIENENDFIFKTNLELFRKFYEYLNINFKDDTLGPRYLYTFDSISLIKQDKIEEEFSNILLEYNSDILNLDEFVNYENGSGIYAIFNNLKNLIYIGKSRNLSSRSLQSFLNKLPYGATYIKIIDSFNEEWIDHIEAISIDFFMPMYNNKKETFTTSHKQYTKNIFLILDKLKEAKLIYPIIQQEITNG